MTSESDLIYSINWRLKTLSKLWYTGLALDHVLNETVIVCKDVCIVIDGRRSYLIPYLSRLLCFIDL